MRGGVGVGVGVGVEMGWKWEIQSLIYTWVECTYHTGTARK